MIETKKLFSILKKNKINFYAGVPDSILKNTKSFFDKLKSNKHMITANEGSAVSLCVGHHLSTGNIACAYMQNSGLGNALNPLISIAHKKVYSIPMLLLIGWRGSPGITDEPQHKLKGAITTEILKLLNINYCILKKEKDFRKLSKLIKYSKKFNQPVACLVPKNILKNNKRYGEVKRKISDVKRKDVIESLLSIINKKTKLISTTGFTSRELHQIRFNKKINRGKDFYMVGGMGHSSMVALGVAMKTKSEVICLDGDGSFLMHLGAVISIGKLFKHNFKHILFNNFSHESVGGQTTNIDKLDIKKLVFSAGYKKYFLIKNKNQINFVLKKFIKEKGPSLLEIKIQPGSLNNLIRPRKLLKIKKIFMKSFKSI